MLSLMAILSEGGPRRALITAAAERSDGKLEGRLRHLCGLSPSQASNAVQLSQGITLADLVEERAVPIAPIRSQAKAIAGKLGCNTQSHIVRIVLTLPPLRPSE